MYGDPTFWNSGPLGQPPPVPNNGGGNGGNGWGHGWLDNFHAQYPNAGNEPQHPLTRPQHAVIPTNQGQQVTPGVFPWGQGSGTGGPIPVSPPPVNGQPGGPQNPPGTPPWYQHFQTYLSQMTPENSPPWLQSILQRINQYSGGQGAV